MKSVGCVIIDVYCSKENVIMRYCVYHILTSNLEMDLIRISLIGTDDFIRKIEFFKQLKFEKSVIFFSLNDSKKDRD